LPRGKDRQSKPLLYTRFKKDYAGVPSMLDFDSFTLVIPTRDNPELCRQVLEQLIAENSAIGMPLRVTFLVNDTGDGADESLDRTVAEERFSVLQPQLLRAKQNYPTVEENIRHTLGPHLDSIDEHFLIIGNSDQPNLQHLHVAVQYLREHQLDLLLVGVLNREMYEGKPVRQLYATPRHINPKNRLGPGRTFGRTIFADAISDYGPVDYLAYIGCQIYTKKFFLEMCRVQEELAEAVYSIPLACLELTSRRDWAVGFFPEIVVTRVDHLQYGPNSGQQGPNWWVIRARTDRGLSDHIFLSVISSSLQLCDKSFNTLVNSQMIAIPRGSSRYLFSNFLFAAVEQLGGYLQSYQKSESCRYAAKELTDIVQFGARLRTVDIGLSEQTREMIGDWLQHFDDVQGYSNSEVIEKLVSGAVAILTLLNARVGMERWVAQQL
jgi:hypothetical protein